MSDERYMKAALFGVKWRGLPVKIGNHKRRWRPLYCRMANGALLYFLFWEIHWRMWWIKDAVYQMGWDACWRQLNGIGEDGKPI